MLTKSITSYWATVRYFMTPPLITQCNDVIMGVMASQITSLKIIYWIVYSGAHQRKHQSSASLAFVWGIHRSPVNSPHKWPVTRKMFPFDDVIMRCLSWRSFFLMSAEFSPSCLRYQALVGFLFFRSLRRRFFRLWWSPWKVLKIERGPIITRSFF